MEDDELLEELKQVRKRHKTTPEELFDKKLCPICQHNDKELIEAEYEAHRITAADVAKLARCKLEDVYAHFDFHKTEKELKTWEKRQLLSDCITNLARRVTKFFTFDDLSPAQTQQITSQLEVLRRYVMSLNELELTSRKEIEITLAEYNKLKELIMTHLCDECYKRVKDALARKA